MSILNKKLYSDKKVLVLGFGVEGISTARFLVKEGVKVAVADQNPKEDLDESAVTQLEKAGVEFLCGSDYLKYLSSYPVIFRSPGVRRFLPELVEAEKKGVEITSQTKLFFDHCPGKIIGVTGTKGKGTTVTLVSQILKEAGKSVFLGGNIGQSPLDFLEKVRSSSWVVLELSSFQLQDLHRSPQIGVVLMVTSEHQDYHATTAEYIQAKESIVKFQSKSDVAVVNADYPGSMTIGALGKGKIYYFSRKTEVKRGAYVRNGKIWLNLDFPSVVEPLEILSVDRLALRGEHNWENIMAASVASALAGAGLESIRKTVVEFKGLEHRLEFVQEVEGVKYYNDSFSTTPETAIAAMRAFQEPLIQVLGGSEKGSDYVQLGREIAGRKNLKAIILIGDTAEKIEKVIEEAGGFKGQIIKGCSNMGEIVSAARKIAGRGDVVLLSPACASFDMFNNYKDRGNQFKCLVKDKLPKEI
jgi:UDP-N-acetylmuramoylalanine--D-glutamate ligase